MHVDQTRMTPKEVSKLLGMSEAWLCLRRKKLGGGPVFFQFGYRGRVFYYKNDVDQWRESQRSAGQVTA